MSEYELKMVKGALAALSQKSTFPVDVLYAKKLLKELIAAQQSVCQTCSTCGGENGKHELDCRVAHNMLADNASW